MNLSLITILQIAILTAGIYVVLGFLRTTRGSGLVRGLTITLLVGMIGLSVIATRLRLEELEYIIEIITGYVVVILVVLFQPELRRGIVALGENPLVGRLLKARRQEVLTEVAKACVSMAKKRQGALIAFERKIGLDAFTETAVAVDAEVNRFLLDSIFHHGSALHDGGVVVRGERIAAAACLFPLTENVELSRSTGTRHRAALGLTEETDAVTVAVSEETGSISICQDGKMRRNVSPAQLEDALRDLLGIDAALEAARARREERGLGRMVWRLFSENVWLKTGALVIACGLYWIAHQELQATKPFSVHVTASPLGATGPTTGRILVALPDDSYHLAGPDREETFVIEASGPRSRLNELEQRLSGLFQVAPEEVALGGTGLDLSEVLWDDEQGVEGLELTWRDETPVLIVERFEERELTLTPAMVPVDTQRIDPRIEARTSEISFSPTSVRIVGPAHSIDRIGTPDLPLLLEELVVRGERRRVERLLGLAPNLRRLGFDIAGNGRVLVSMPIQPVEEEIEVPREVALVSSNPAHPGAASTWLPPTETARVVIVTRGILPPDRSSPAYAEVAQRLREWVEANVRVVIDVTRIPDGSGRGTLELIRKDAEPSIFGVNDPSASVDFELKEPTTLLLTRKPAEETSSSTGSNGDEEDS